MTATEVPPPLSDPESDSERSDHVLETPRARRRIPLPSFTSFHYRDFRLWWILSATFMLSRGMFQISLAWLILELTDSSAWVGVTVFTTGVPIFLLTFPSGVLADRMDRKRLILIVQAGSVATAIVIAVIVGAGWATPRMVILFAVLSGTQQALSLPVTRAVLPTLVPREHLLNAVALGSMSQNSSQLVGPLFAGTLIAVSGISASFIGSAAFLGVGMVAAMAMRLPARAPAPARAGGWARHMVNDLAEGLRWIRERRPLAVIIGLMVVTGLFMVGPHQTLQPIIVRDLLHAGPQGYGLTATVMSVGTLTTSLMLTSMGSLRNKGGFFAMALIGGSVGFAGYAFSPSFGVALIFFFIWGGFGGFFVNMSQSLLQSHTPDHMMGRVMALNTVAMQGFMPIGALQAGLLATALGPQSAVLFSAVTCASLATLALVTVPSFRRLS